MQLHSISRAVASQKPVILGIHMRWNVLLWSLFDVQNCVTDEAKLLAFNGGYGGGAPCCYQDVLGLHRLSFSVSAWLQLGLEQGWSFSPFSLQGEYSKKGCEGAVIGTEGRRNLRVKKMCRRPQCHAETRLLITWKVVCHAYRRATTYKSPLPQADAPSQGRASTLAGM